MRLGIYIFVLSAFFHSPLLAATKSEVLEHYQRIIVASNQMKIYGYDLREVTFKLKKATELIVANEFKGAEELLTAIQKDLRAIEAKGPEHLRRERKLVWLEIFGDFLQQVAIFLVLSFILLRFKFLKASFLLRRPSMALSGKLTLCFLAASLFSALVGLLRYGQSAWAFVDLEILLVGISGLVGGIWVGLIVGLANTLLRFLAVPGEPVYLAVPVAAGLAAGIFHQWRTARPLRNREVFMGGLLLGLLHSALMYVPIFRFLPVLSFAAAIFFISFSEAAIIFLFFMMAYQIFKEEKRKETEQELVRARLRFLQAQINPHFLFNALNTISAVCGEENAKRARYLIVQLSALFRRLAKEEGDFVSLQDEFEYIDAYLDIERARFGEKLQIEKDIRLSESARQCQVPILALQPLVENAVKHGISKKAEGGKLTLAAREEDSRIVIDIRDTGVGMSDQAKNNLFQKPKAGSVPDKNHTGIGLSNIRERLERTYGERFKISVTSTPNQGTLISLVFPKSHD